MHLVFVEQHGLEETQTAIDLDQSPAELVVLSFSDSDLTAFAAAWHTANLPQLLLRAPRALALSFRYRTFP